MRRGERARVVQEIAVGLDVHDEPLGAPMRERDPDRRPDLRRRPERAARMAARTVNVPEPQRPVLERVRRQDPVLALDDRPELGRESRRGQRRCVPVLARLLLPASADLVVHPPQLGAARAPLAGPARADGFPQRRQRETGVGDDREGDRLELAEVFGPFALTKLRQPDVDDRRARSHARALLVR
ncbi:MAG: hypothetical protein E6I64_10890, partial [Chloroflexi bacterium]